MHLFTISPDRTKVLLPIDKNRFAIYKFGERDARVPIPEKEGFGDNFPDLSPAWKGNDRISCMVSENSRFLMDETGNAPKRERKEIVILRSDGQRERILSKPWPDEPIP